MLIEEKCLNCECFFEVDDSDQKDSWELEYCSFKCYLDFEGMNCSVCGQKYLPTAGRRTTCSVGCQTKLMNSTKLKNAKKKQCEVCNKIFLAKTFNAKYCSNKCRKKIDQKRYKNIKKITSFDIFSRDRFRCQYCGKTPKNKIELIVDHIYPVSEGGKSDFHNLITACKKCNNEKGNRILPLQLTLALWTNCNGHFTYIKAQAMWTQMQKGRENRLVKTKDTQKK